jgi:hypothetical protein
VASQSPAAEAWPLLALLALLVELLLLLLLLLVRALLKALACTGSSRPHKGVRKR